jgi:RHS repeat-associated protein
VAVKMYGFHGRREPGPEGFLHTKGGLMYYHSDRLGSPVAITDRHGEPVARYAWDAYGMAMAGVFDPYNTVGFIGKQRDGATGLTYFGARWYDADSGRFMSRDPIRDGWNWYAYVGGDPVNFVDEWGLFPWYVHEEIDRREERKTKINRQEKLGIAITVVGGAAIFAGGGVPAAVVMATGAVMYTEAKSGNEFGLEESAKFVSDLLTPPEYTAVEMFSQNQSINKEGNNEGTQK